MKVGIIGGSGFLGMNILRRLSQNSKLELFSPLRQELDLNRPETLAQFLKELDTVIYLAHEGGPSVVKNWSEESDQNLLPLRNFLNAANRLKRTYPLKVIYFSSGGGIYGHSATREPWKETDELHPVSPYGKLKKEIEEKLEEACQQNIIRAIVLRPGNPYGNAFPHRKDQGIVDVAITKIKSGKPFQLFAEREFVRDFIHMDDLTSAVEKALYFSGTFEIFNIGSGVGTSIGAALDLVQKCFSKALIIETIPATPGVIPVDWNVLDISKAKTLLGWEPKIPIEKGIRSLCRNSAS